VDDALTLQDSIEVAKLDWRVGVSRLFRCRLSRAAKKMGTQEMLDRYKKKSQDAPVRGVALRLRFVVVWWVVAACAGSSVESAVADDAAAAPTVNPPGLRHAARVSTGSSLEHQVAKLSIALDIDQGQQSKLLIILEQQRDDVRKVWRDARIAPSDRVVATRRIGDQTADQIRGILNEDQRKKYIPPKVSVPPPNGSDVDSWMSAQQGKKN